jgi:hypothetical protein
MLAQEGQHLNRATEDLFDETYSTGTKGNSVSFGVSPEVEHTPDPECQPV